MEKRRAETEGDSAGWRKILIHCRGGIDRTGTVAAQLLVELGMPHEKAIKAVRAARYGTIETRDQERYV
ncbi:MAG: tyrosine-protein phosphatase [Smithellaceae bacterium]